jgi:hypothetical protein
MVDFLFISARSLGADNADETVAPPGEHDPINICINPAQGNPANLPLVFAIVDPLQDCVGEDFGSGQKRDAMPGEVGSGFLVVPLEFQFHASRCLSL